MLTEVGFMDPERRREVMEALKEEPYTPDPQTRAEMNAFWRRHETEMNAMRPAEYRLAPDQLADVLNKTEALMDQLMMDRASFDPMQNSSQGAQATLTVHAGNL